MGSTRCFALIWISAASVLAAPGAQAQAPDAQNAGESLDATDAQRAELLTEEARDAIENRRFAEAVDLLRRSLDAFPTARAAFNLARVLREQGRPTEALALCADLLAGEYGTLPDERAAQLRTIQASAQGDLAHLTVTAHEAIELRMNGNAIGRVTPAEPETLSVDPGRHVFSARFEDGRVDDRSLDLARGTRQQLSFGVAAPIVEDPPVEEDTPPGDESSSIFASPWFWIVAGAVVVAGAVTAIVLLSEDSAKPLAHPVLGNAATLGSVRFP